MPVSVLMVMVYVWSVIIMVLFSLLVLGLAQMYDHHLPWYMLVHHYMIPTKQPDQIKTRCSNRYKCDPDNPIRKYKKTGAIPSPPDLCPPYSGPNLLESDTSVLPDWLLILQQELKKLSQEEVNLSCQQLSNIPGEFISFTEILELIFLSI